jgi:protocatechuate 3,4-dioxygenase beta subunit
MTHRTRPLGSALFAGLILLGAACSGSAADDATTTTEPTTTTSIPPESSEGAVRATPQQPEGPYYPVLKPSDRDNDLTSVTGAPARPAGDRLALDGLLIYSDGSAVEQATIEIWQTDSSGVYLHPDFADESVDPGFQYYGESVTDEFGEWSFRTILPAAYESRPPHIHAKVLVDGDVVLITQIYFTADGSDPGTPEPLLVAEVFPAPESVDAEMVASHVIVLPG